MLCIPKDIAKKLREAAKGGEFSILTLAEMTSEQRNATFAQYADKGTAKSINVLFEKALASEQQNALKNWAEKVFSPKEKSKAQYKHVMKAIMDLEADGVLNPAEADGFFRDLAADKLGITITAEEAKNISERSKQLEELSKKPSDNDFGLPNKEYFKARKEMFDYLNSLAPSSRLKILTSTIFRGNMLFSVKSPVTNIIGNTTQGILQAFERRLSSKSIGGMNGEISLKYVKEAIAIFRASGYDVTRMQHIDDTQRTLGEQNLSSEGEGAVRATGRFYEDVVFKTMMALPDVAFSAIHFADSANISSSKIAESEGLSGAEAKKRALEIFTDATSLEPKLEEGMIVRQQAIADAAYATYQNDGYYSTFALAIRKAINIGTGDLRLGDQLMPFVKTPANVIGAGIDAAGVGLIRAAIQLPSALKAAEMGDPAPMREVMRHAVRSGLGLTMAIIISSMFDPDEFIGEYPTSAAERELLRLKRATPNSVKIGNKWVSLDYFGPIGAPLIGMLYARKYGDTIPDYMLQYAKGVGIAIANFPGYDATKETIRQIDTRLKESKPGEGADKETGALVTDIAGTLTDYIAARIVPAAFYDFGKATDDFERKPNYDEALGGVKARVPFVREKLPVRTDVFGEAVRNESPVSTFLFGSRLKTAADNKLLREMVRLDASGNLPSITDVEKTSTRVKTMKAQLEPAKYEEFLQEFKLTFAEKVSKKMDGDSYKKADDEKKAKLINAIKDDTLDSKLKKYGYKKPKN